MPRCPERGAAALLGTVCGRGPPPACRDPVQLSRTRYWGPSIAPPLQLTYRCRVSIAGSQGSGPRRLNRSFLMGRGRPAVLDGSGERTAGLTTGWPQLAQVMREALFVAGLVVWWLLTVQFDLVDSLLGRPDLNSVSH